MIDKVMIGWGVLLEQARDIIRGVRLGVRDYEAGLLALAGRRQHRRERLRDGIESTWRRQSRSSLVGLVSIREAILADLRDAESRDMLEMLLVMPRWTHEL